jgi:ribonuclease T2
MKHAFLTTALALPLLLSACKSAPGTYSASSNPNATSDRAAPRLSQGTGSDYYLLNLSWSPEFCYSHPNAVECASHSTFVLHGLWPQNNNGNFPENCSSAPGPSDPSSFSDIYPDQGLLQHEWRTHGTCSGLSADDFLTTARAAYRSISIPPALANLTSQTSMPPDEIVSLFTRANPALSCDSVAIGCGHNFLTAVEICLDKSLHPSPVDPSAPAAPTLSASHPHDDLPIGFGALEGSHLCSKRSFSPFEVTKGPQFRVLTEDHAQTRLEYTSL